MGVWHIPANVKGLTNHRCPSSHSASVGFYIQFQTRLLFPTIYFPSVLHHARGPTSPPIPAPSSCCVAISSLNLMLPSRCVLSLSVSAAAVPSGRASHTFQSPTEVIKDTQPQFLKELNCLSVEHKFVSERPSLALG